MADKQDYWTRKLATRSARVQKRLADQLEPGEEVRAATFGRTQPLMVRQGLWLLLNFVTIMRDLFRALSGRSLPCGLVLTDRNLYYVLGSVKKAKIVQTFPLERDPLLTLGAPSQRFPVVVNGETMMYIVDMGAVLVPADARYAGLMVQMFPEVKRQARERTGAAGDEERAAGNG